MATTTSTKIKDTDGSWIHGCFIVKVGDDFDTYKQIVQYAQADEIWGSSTAPDIEPAVKKVLDTSGSTDGTGSSDSISPTPLYFSKRKCRDTSLGGNDAINPLPQFGIDDDIAFGHTELDLTGSDATNLQVSMGQVYSENYDDLQQILYLGFGIPIFNNIGGFWANATDADMANFMNKGSGMSAQKLGYLLGSAPIRIIQIATIPYKWLVALIDTLQNVPISKYYAFSSRMPMYFRFVNTILVMLATNMNMMGSADNITTTGSQTSGTTALGLENEGTTAASGDLSGMSTIFRLYGLDMAQIMTKKFLYEQGNQKLDDNRWTDKALEALLNQNNGDGVTDSNQTDPNQSTNPTDNTTNSNSSTTDDTISLLRYWKKGFLDNFWDAAKTTLYDGHLFIGFRIDKGMGGSESFSNTTGESKIAQQVNEQFQSGQEARFQTFNGQDDAGGLLSSAISATTALFQGITSSISNIVGFDAMGAAMTGQAKISIPEVWQSSSWNRTASFSITCLSPYGDFESIFQSEYVPFACILAGALPRGTGYSSYSAPFVCQAYCRGIFSSPLCMIESLEVTRGADQFGMTAARLPLKLTMHVTLKDLTPTMYMNMGGDKGLINAIFGTDDNFGEYMLTLSGIGLRDRLSPWRSMRRKVDILLSTTFKNKLSPYMLSMEGNSRFIGSRIISRIISAGKNLPGN